MGMHASVQLQKLSPSTSQNPTEFISHISNSILHDHNTMWKLQRLQLKIPKTLRDVHRSLWYILVIMIIKDFHQKVWLHYFANFILSSEVTMLQKNNAQHIQFFSYPLPPPRLSFSWLLKYLQIKCTASTSHVILVVFSIWSKTPNFFPNLLPS